MATKKKEEVKKEKIEKEVKGEPKQTIQDIVEEDVKKAESVVEEKEEVKEDPKEEEKPKEKKKEEVDVDKATKEAKEEGAKETTEKVLKAIGVSKKDKEEAEEEGLKAPWEERGEVKPASWKEMAEYSADLAEFKREKKLKAEQEKTAKDEKEAKEATEKRQAEMNKQWDEDLADLQKRQLLPKISKELTKKMTAGEPLSKKEKKDPGVKAQTKLFNLMVTESNKRAAKGLPPITDIKRIFFDIYQPSLKPAGIDAPVSGASTTSDPGTQSYDYSEDHNKSIDDVVRGK